MRYAIVLKDGTIANIAEIDGTTAHGLNYMAVIENAGHTLVKLEDVASDMGGINVEPGDICTDTSKKTYSKGVSPGTKPVDVKPTKPIDVTPIIE